MKNWLRDERGTELIEAAITLPVLLTLLLGIISMGRGYNVYQTITRAAREGARYAVTPSCATCTPAAASCNSVTLPNTFPPDSDVKCVITAALAAASLNAAPNPAITIQRNVSLDSSDPIGNQVSGVIVSFGYPFQFVIPFTSLNLTTITLSTQVQMRQEF